MKFLVLFFSFLLGIVISSDIVCFNTYSDDPSVCSGRGECISFNNCVCDDFYYGFNCQLDNSSLSYTTHDIIYFTSPTTGTWEEHKEYCTNLGAMIGIPLNETIENELAEVFYEHFQLIIGLYYNPTSDETYMTIYPELYPYDYMNFREGYPNANYHYMVTLSISTKGYSDGWGHVSYQDDGNKALCGMYKCDGLWGNDSNICSGHGSCMLPDVCNCDLGYGDTFCQTLIGQTTEWSFESSTIYVTENSSSFEASQVQCSDTGGNLFIASSEDEETAVGRELAADGYSTLWIGLYIDGSEEIRQELDDSLFTNFTRWEDGFPFREDSKRGIAMHVFEQSSDGDIIDTKWTDEPSHVQYHGLCIKPS